MTYQCVVLFIADNCAGILELCLLLRSDVCWQVDRPVIGTYVMGTFSDGNFSNENPNT